MSEINIKVMTDTAFQKCLKEADVVAKNMKDHPTDDSWLAGFVGEEPFQEKNYQIEDFTLIVPKEETKIDDEIENGKILYEHLKKLPAYILGDLMFWEWIAFEKGYQAAIATIEPTDKTVASMWFAKGAGENRRGVMLHVLARSFLRVKMSILPKQEDPYELTRYLFKDSRCYRNMVYRNISDIRAIAHSFIRAEKTISEKYNIILGDATNRKLMKAISNIGSAKFLDAIPEEELYPEVLETLENIVQEENRANLPNSEESTCEE